MGGIERRKVNAPPRVFAIIAYLGFGRCSGTVNVPRSRVWIKRERERERERLGTKSAAYKSTRRSSANRLRSEEQAKQKKLRTARSRAPLRWAVLSSTVLCLSAVFEGNATRAATTATSIALFYETCRNSQEATPLGSPIDRSNCGFLRHPDTADSGNRAFIQNLPSITPPHKERTL